MNKIANVDRLTKANANGSALLWAPATLAQCIKTICKLTMTEDSLTYIKAKQSKLLQMTNQLQRHFIK